MSRKNAHPVKPVPAIHSSDCACPRCCRQNTPVGGGRAPEQFARLSEDGLSRFATLDTTHYGRNRKDAFCSLREDFIDRIDQRTARTRAAWDILLEREPEAAACLRLYVLERLSQRALAAQTGLSQATVHRRLRLAREFLLAAVGAQTAPELRGLVAS